MINARTFLGYPTDFQGICFIYPPLIKDIVSCEKYQIYQRILTLAQEDLDDLMNAPPVEDNIIPNLKLDENGNIIIPPPPKRVQAPSPYDYIMSNAFYSEEFQRTFKEAINFFTHQDTIFLWDLKAIYIGDEQRFIDSNYQHVKEIKFITEQNFMQFQNAIRLSIGALQMEIPNPDEDPRITRMKAKARYRDKIKAQGSSALNLESMLAAICCSNLGITPLTIGEISYGTVKALFEMYQNKERYELDIQSLLSGADPKKIKPKHWITNLND